METCEHVSASLALPVMMMAATIASWENEANSFSFLPTTNVNNWLNETFQNVSKADSSTGSKSSLQVNEVLDSKIGSDDYKDIREKIVENFRNAVTAFKKEKIKEYKAANEDASDKDAENAVAGQLFKASDNVAKMSSFKKGSVKSNRTNRQKIRFHCGFAAKIDLGSVRPGSIAAKWSDGLDRLMNISYFS